MGYTADDGRLFPFYLQGINDGWEYHDVCVTNKGVLDPIIGTPVDIESYSMKMFSMEVIPYKIG